MRVLIDTNILVSAIYSKTGTANQAYRKAVESPYQAIICEQSLEEIRRVFNRKFPDKIKAYESFIAMAVSVVAIAPVPCSPHSDEDKIRDFDDRPILRAAIAAGADILLTGDKDFLESGLKTPLLINAADFLNYKNVDSAI